MERGRLNLVNTNTGLVNDGRLWLVHYNQSNFYRFWGNIWFLCFHWSPSIGKSRMTPVSFVKTTESNDVSFVTIRFVKTAESYEVCRWLIRGLPSEYMSNIYRNVPKRVGLITASVQTVRAVHNCNSSLVLCAFCNLFYISKLTLRNIFVPKFSTF